MENKKLHRLETIPDVFLAAVEKLLPQLYDELIQQTNIDVTQGRIVRSNQNIARALQFIAQYEAWLVNPDVSPYSSEVDDFIGEFSIQKRINDELLIAFGTRIPESAEVAYTASRAEAVKMLIGDRMTSRFIGDIRDTIVTSITNERSYSEMVAAISEVVQGGETREGRLLNWAKQVAHDQYAMTDRIYTTTAARDMGVEWWRYLGGKVKKSRCFCVHRDGKYFHTTEVESWGKLENIGECKTKNGWAGRMPNTDEDTIFSKLGGYKCLHSLMPVGETVVPPEVLARFAK